MRERGGDARRPVAERRHPGGDRLPVQDLDVDARGGRGRERERRLGEHRLAGALVRLILARQDQRALDVRPPGEVVVAALAELEQPRQAEAVLRADAGAGAEGGRDVLVEHGRLARPPQDPLQRAGEAEHVDARPRRGQVARPVGDLPLDVGALLAVAEVAEALRDAVGAEHALGRGREAGRLQLRDEVLQLRAARGGEALEHDLRRGSASGTARAPPRARRARRRPPGRARRGPRARAADG